MALEAVVELHGGLSKSSMYFFVIEGDRLVHISRYATNSRRVAGGVEYEVDIGRLVDKQAVEVDAESGGASCRVYVLPAEIVPRVSKVIYRARGNPLMPPEVFLDNEAKSKRVAVNLRALNRYRLDYLTPRDAKFLEGPWRRYYLGMLLDIKAYAGLLAGSGVAVEFPNLLRCQLASGAYYPLSFLIPYSDRARSKSTEVLTKQIHQAWAALSILGELKRSGIKVEVGGVVDFRQDRYAPLFTVEVKGRRYSFWHEFDLNPRTACGGEIRQRLLEGSGCPALEELYRGAGLDYYMKEDIPHPIVYQIGIMLTSPDTFMRLFKDPPRSARKYGIFPINELRALSRMLWREEKQLRGVEHVPLRPDLVVLEGIETCDELCKRGLKTKIVVELKDKPYSYWGGDVERQVTSYVKLFRSARAIVASMREVPDDAKTRLRAIGVEVIDGVYPGGPGEKAFLDAVKGALSG